MANMPAALLLSLQPPEAECVNQYLRVLKVEDQMGWFHFLLPVDMQATDDRRALQLRLGEFAHLGTGTLAKLGLACGLSAPRLSRPQAVGRAMLARLLRSPEAEPAHRRQRRGPHVGRVGAGHGPQPAGRGS